MRPTAIVLLLFLCGNAHGCGESKKSAPEKGAEAKQTEPESVLAVADGSTPPDQGRSAEFGAILKGNSGNILADPGGTPDVDIDMAELTAKSAFNVGPVAGPAEPHYRRAKAHLHAREFQDAVAELQSALEIDPKQGRVHFAMGQAHGGLDDAKAARASFEQAIHVVDEWSAGTSLDRSIQHARGDGDWVAEAYRLLGYAIRESGGSDDDIRAAWENYVDRATVEDHKTKEVRKLLIPLRQVR